MVEPGFHTYNASLDYLFRIGDLRANDKVEEAANIQLIQQAVMAIGRLDAVALGELLADDVRLEIRGAEEFPFVRNSSGRAEVLDAIWKNFAAVQDQRPRLESVVAQGNTVMVISTEEGIIRETGKAYRIEGVQRFVCRDGKIVLVHEILVPV